MNYPSSKSNQWSRGRSILLVIGALLISVNALAAGLILTPRGVRPLARGGAFVAGADDVHALSYNPAGMAFAREEALVDFAVPIYNTDFTRMVSDASGPMETVSGEGLGLPVPTMGAIYGFGLHDNLRFGAAIGAEYASLQNWPLTLEDGTAAPQRYSVVDYRGTAVAKIAAGASYRFGDWFAVGATFQLLTGRFVSHVAATNCDGVICTQPENPAYDAVIQMESGVFAVPGVQIGIIAVPTRWLRLGVAWETGYGISRNADLRIRLPSAAMFDSAAISPENPTGNLSMAFPMILRTGLEFRGGDWLRAEASFVWEGWSVHDKLIFSSQGTTITNVSGLGDYSLGDVTIDRNFRDTWSVRAGFEIRPMIGSSRSLTLRLGTVYEPSAIPDESMSPMVVDLDKVLATGGLGYDFGSFYIDATYAFAWTPTRTVTTSQIRQTSAVRPEWEGTTTIGNGTYRSSGHVIGLGMGLRF